MLKQSHKQERRECRNSKDKMESGHQRTRDHINKGSEVRKHLSSNLKSRRGYRYLRKGSESTIEEQSSREWRRKRRRRRKKRERPTSSISANNRTMIHLHWERSHDNRQGNRQHTTTATPPHLLLPPYKKQRTTNGTMEKYRTRISSMQDSKKVLNLPIFPLREIAEISDPGYSQQQQQQQQCGPCYKEQAEEIHIWRSCHHHGLFSNFTLALTFLKDHFRQDGRVAVAIDWSNLKTYPTPRNSNLWDMLFMQPFTTSGQDIRHAKILRTSSQFPGDFTYFSGISDRGGDIHPKILHQGRQLVLQHIRVRPHIEEKALKFISAKMKGFQKILAVHIRRTDKYTESRLNFMLRDVDIYHMIQLHLTMKGYDSFFLCTDDQKLKTFMSSVAGKTCITYNSHLSKHDHVPPHFDENIDGYSKAEDVVVEVLCMASCSGFISTLSNVANGVLFFANDTLIRNHVYLHNLVTHSVSKNSTNLVKFSE